MRTLHGLLQESARRAPERTAVVDPERGATVSYGDLDAATGRLGAALERAGVRPGDRVGICAPKSIGAVAVLFGALKAGAAYIPVDPSVPPARNAAIFCDVGARALVVERALIAPLAAHLSGPAAEELTDLRPFGVDLVLLRPEWVQAPTAAPPPEGLAYVLYTSGSTGQPKGVMHTHATALAFVDWCSEAFAPTEEDRFSSHAPFHFDLSILDLYVPLKHGAAVVLLGEEVGKQPLLLARLIAEERITAWYSTPSVLRLLAAYGRLERHDHPALRLVNFAGEVFPVKHLRAVMAAWPHARYFNLYGPTETNVCTHYAVPGPLPPERTEPLPIGKPCSGVRTRVAGPDGWAVPRGEEGELLVAGGSVMPGYWNLPDHDARAFHLDADGTRWYRTGDVVHEDEEGDYRFLGRRDRMVKRHGYRVELGEIEAALHRHPAVAEAAVLALPGDDGDVRIEAFVACAGPPPSLVAMRRHCTETLPLYMMPDGFSFGGALPKTSTDKMDYRRLSERV